MKKLVLAVAATGMLATHAMAEVYPAPPGSALHELVSAQALSDCQFSTYPFVDNISVDADAMNIIATCTDGTDSGMFTFPINDPSVRAEVGNLAEFYSDTADLAAAEAAINAGLPLNDAGDDLNTEEALERMEVLEGALDALGKASDLELGEYPIANQDPTYPNYYDSPHFGSCVWCWANWEYAPWLRNYFYPNVLDPWLAQHASIIGTQNAVSDMTDDEFNGLIASIYAAVPVDNAAGKDGVADYDPNADHSDNALFNKQAAPVAAKTKLQECQEQWNEGLYFDSCSEVRQNPEGNSGDGIDNLMDNG